MIVKSIVLLGTLAVSLGQVGDTSHLHPWLARVVAERSARTSQMTFTIETRMGTTEGRVGRYRTETVGDNVYQSVDERDPPGAATPQAGDDRSWVAPVPLSIEAISWEGNTLSSAESWPDRLLRVGRDGDWPTHEARSFARYMRPNRNDREQIIDARVVGLGPRIGQGSGVLGLSILRSEHELDGAVWTELPGSDVDTLIAAIDDVRSVKWEFSSAQGHQPIRVEWRVGERVIKHSETELQEVDGRWLPKAVRTYTHIDNPEGELAQVLTVTDASFDKPWHRQEPFAPDDIGVVFGTKVFTDTLEGTLDTGSWNGLGYVTGDEFFDLHLGWGIDYHPDLAKRIWGDGGQAAYFAKLAVQRKAYLEEYAVENSHPHPSLIVAAQEDEKDAWDLYVAAFIKEHELNEPRVKRANALLDQAKKLRDHYRRKNKSDQRKAEAAGDTAKLDRVAAIEERIFNRVLKRGLEKLLPRNERPEDRGD